MAATSDSASHSRPSPAMCHSMAVTGALRMVSGTAMLRYQSKPNTGRTRCMVGVPSSVEPRKALATSVARMPCRNEALASWPT